MGHNSTKIVSQTGVEAMQNLLGVLIATTLLFNGAADPVIRARLFVLFGLASLLVLFVPLKDGTVRSLIRRTLFLSMGLIFWVGLQAFPLPLWLPVHHVWHDLSVTFGTDYGYLSVNPSATRAALPSLILPILVFVSSAMLSQTDALAIRFWYKLSYVGLFVVVVSISRQMIFPESLTFSGTSLASGQFSGVFINRNIAASFFGLTGFVIIGCLTHKIAQDKLLATQVPSMHTNQFYWQYVFLSGAFFLIAVCLILTRSRAGSLVGLAVLLPCLGLVLQNGLQARFKHFLPDLGIGKFTSVVITLMALLIFLALYGEPVLSRVETTKDTARWCTWGATLVAIRENIMFGTGFATFSDIFPLYRDSSCDSADVIWLRAHNSFLEFYLGLGLPGLILGATICISIVKTIFTGIRVRQSLKGIPIVLAGATIFVAAHSLVDFPLQIPGITIYYSAVIGVGASLCLKRSKTSCYS